jgi:hypothetical protein
LNAAKSAAHVGDHHVADNELGSRMRRVDLIGGFQWLSFFQLGRVKI